MANLASPTPRPRLRSFPPISIPPSQVPVSASPGPLCPANTLEALQFPVFLGAVSSTQGAYGSVWGVQDFQLRMAVKVTKTLNSDWLRIARNEYETLRVLNHPNILAVFGFAVAQDLCTARLYMAYIPGNTLEEVISQRKRLKEAELKMIMGQLFLALAYLAGKGVVHRDINPRNLMWTGTILTLIDFQTACDQAKCEGPVGSPHYQAPEMWLAQPYDSQADMWSAGCVFQRLIRHCYREETPLSPAASELAELCTLSDATQRLSARQALGHAWLALA